MLFIFMLYSFITVIFMVWQRTPVKFFKLYKNVQIFMKVLVSYRRTHIVGMLTTNCFLGNWLYESIKSFICDLTFLQYLLLILPSIVCQLQGSLDVYLSWCCHFILVNLTLFQHCSLFDLWANQSQLTILFILKMYLSKFGKVLNWCTPTFSSNHVCSKFLITAITSYVSECITLPQVCAWTVYLHTLLDISMDKNPTSMANLALNFQTMLWTFPFTYPLSPYPLFWLEFKILWKPRNLIPVWKVTDDSHDPLTEVLQALGVFHTLNCLWLQLARQARSGYDCAETKQVYPNATMKRLPHPLFSDTCRRFIFLKAGVCSFLLFVLV